MKNFGFPFSIGHLMLLKDSRIDLYSRTASSAHLIPFNVPWDIMTTMQMSARSCLTSWENFSSSFFIFESFTSNRSSTCNCLHETFLTTILNLSTTINVTFKVWTRFLFKEMFFLHFFLWIFRQYILSLRKIKLCDLINFGFSTKVN